MFETKWKIFWRFIKSADFFKALLMCFSIILPVVVFSYLDLLHIGTGIALGVLLCSPSDIPGNSKHRINGMLCAILLSSIATLIGGLAAEMIWIMLPVVMILVFLYAYISVFGFRASLVSFCGLLAFVLSFADLGGQSRWTHLLFIVCGGLFYVVTSTVFLWIRPRMHIEQLLAETMELTSKLLEIKKIGLTIKQDRDELIERQFKLQAEITEKHEKLREVLLDARKRSGKSNPARRKLLIFIDLVDILELAVSNPVNFEKIDDFAPRHPEIINTFGKLLGDMSKELKLLSECLIDNKKIISNRDISKSIEEMQLLITKLDLEDFGPEKRNDFLIITNLLEYEKKSFEKIKSIQRVLSNLVVKSSQASRSKENKKFITPIDYRFEILLENLSFSSPIFRHSLRLVLLFVIGIIIGKLFVFQNAYWILLTLIVIMRPSYGLTKERSQKRIAGTLIGGVIAFGAVWLVQDPVVYSVLAIVTFMLAFSLIQRNYVIAATFITLSIVFTYALLKPNAFEVIQFRVIDTSIGAMLGFLGNFLLWPSWEYRGIEKYMVATIEANIAYLKEIDVYYHNKKNGTTEYKLARKQAFLRMGNLSAAFQRMAQEPKSVQKDLAQLYRFIVLNQTFLSSSASLGTYIRDHQTTKVSVHYESYIWQIINNLTVAAGKLNNQKVAPIENLDHIKNADTYLKDYIEQLEKQRESIGGHENTKQLEKNELEIREAHLVTEQLKWLYEISVKLKKKI